MSENHSVESSFEENKEIVNVQQSTHITSNKRRTICIKTPVPPPNVLPPKLIENMGKYPIKSNTIRPPREFPLPQRKPIESDFTRSNERKTVRCRSPVPPSRVPLPKPQKDIGHSIDGFDQEDLIKVQGQCVIDSLNVNYTCFSCVLPLDRDSGPIVRHFREISRVENITIPCVCCGRLVHMTITY